MWRQLLQDDQAGGGRPPRGGEPAAPAAAALTPGRRTRDSDAEDNNIVPASQPTPMMTPATPTDEEMQHQHNPLLASGATGRYADYLAEVAGVGDSDDSSIDAGGVASDNSAAAESDDEIVRPAPYNAPLAEWSAGYFSVASKPPIGISGQTIASSISGITDVNTSSGAGSSSPDSGGSPADEEVEEVIVSSDSAEDTPEEDGGDGDSKVALRRSGASGQSGEDTGVTSEISSTNATEWTIQQKLEHSQYAELKARHEGERFRSSGTDSSADNSSEQAAEIAALRAELERGRAANAQLELSKGRDVLEEKLKALQLGLEEAEEGRDEDVSRLQAREDALIKELTCLRAYTNQAMSGNLQERKGLRVLIEELKLEVAGEKLLKQKALDEAKRASSSSGSQTASSGEFELLAQIEALQREKSQLELDVADEKLLKEKALEDAKQASSSSGSQTTSSGEAELAAQIEELQREKIEREATLKDEIKASDDALAQVKEQLALANEQANLAYNAKQIAEDERDLVRYSEPGDVGKAIEDASDELKKRQISQLKAENKLMQQMAVSSRRRLDSEKDGLHRRLEAVQEEADTAKYLLQVAEEELEKVKASSSSQSSSDAQAHPSYNDLEIERDAIAEELRRLKNSQSTSSATGTSSDNDELRAAQDALRDHVAVSEKEVRQLEHDKMALKERLETLVNQDIRTSDDVIAALRAELRENYDRAKSKEVERQNLTHHISKLKGELQKSQYAEHKDYAEKRIEALEEQLQEAEYAGHVAKEEAMKLKELSSSQTSSSEAESRLKDAEDANRMLQADKDALKVELAKISEEVQRIEKQKNADIAKRKEELRASEEMAAQLEIAKEQATLAYEAKLIAEDDLKAQAGQSNSTSSGSGGQSDALMLRKLEQMKAEKRLTQKMAAAIKERLESKNRELAVKLEAGAGGADVAILQQDLLAANARITAEKEASKNRRKELERKVKNLEAEVKAAKFAKLLAEEELKSSSQSTTSGSVAGSNTEGDAARELREQMNELRAQAAVDADELQATVRRLEWEKKSRLSLLAKMDDLKAEIRKSAQERQKVEDALKQVQESDGSVSNSTDAEGVAGVLRRRINELEAERKATMQNFQELERKIQRGKSNYGNEVNYLRNAKLNSLVQESEALERMVDNLTQENEELQKASQVFERDQDLQQRIIEESIGVSTAASGGSSSPHLEDQVKSLLSQIEVLRARLAHALRGEEQSKEAEKKERGAVLDLQSRMDKVLLQLQSLKMSSREQEQKAASTIAKRDEEISSLNSKLEEAIEENRSLRSSGKLVSTDATTDDQARLVRLIEGKNKDLLRRNEQLENEKAELYEQNDALAKQLSAERHARHEDSRSAKETIALLQYKLDTATNQLSPLTSRDVSSIRQQGKDNDGAEMLSLRDGEEVQQLKRLLSQRDAEIASVKQNLTELLEAMQSEIRSISDDLLVQEDVGHSGSAT